MTNNKKRLFLNLDETTVKQFIDQNYKFTSIIGYVESKSAHSAFREKIHKTATAISFSNAYIRKYYLKDPIFLHDNNDYKLSSCREDIFFWEKNKLNQWKKLFNKYDSSNHELLFVTFSPFLIPYNKDLSRTDFQKILDSSFDFVDIYANSKILHCGFGIGSYTKKYEVDFKMNHDRLYLLPHIHMIGEHIDTSKTLSSEYLSDMYSLKRKRRNSIPLECNVQQLPKGDDLKRCLDYILKSPYQKIIDCAYAQVTPEDKVKVSFAFRKGKRTIESSHN